MKKCEVRFINKLIIITVNNGNNTQYGLVLVIFSCNVSAQ